MMTTQLVRRQVETYREAWREDYQSAGTGKDLGEFVRHGLHLFVELRRTDAIWRDRVIRGHQVYSDETDRLMNSLFAMWLEVSSNLLRSHRAKRRPDSAVEGIEDLRKVQDEAIDILHGWKPPKLCAMPGLRHHKLNRKQADALSAIADQGVSSMAAGPMAECSVAEFVEGRRLRVPAPVTAG